MKTATLVFLLVAAGGAAISARVLSKELIKGRELEGEFRRLDRMVALRDDLETENGRLRSAIADSLPLKTLRKEQGRLIGASWNMDRLQLQENQLKAALGERTDPVWLEWAPVLYAKDWRDAGQATPSDALESLLWAARGGDVERVQGLLALSPDAQGEANQAFAALPESAQKQYATPAGWVAALVAANLPDDYAAVSPYPITSLKGERAGVVARVEANDGEQNDLILEFTRQDGAWQLNVPAGVIRSYGRGQ